MREASTLLRAWGDGDLQTLERQLQRWELKSAPRRTELLAVAPRTPQRALVLRAAPRFERDAGTGRALIDPVPGLIADLTSPEPRARVENRHGDVCAVTRNDHELFGGSA